MMRITLAIGLGLLALASPATAETQPKTERAWLATEWNGERAYVADSGGWRAIVSVERGRLVYFGASADGQNLLFAPPTKDHPAGWGGHRLWLGPQADWAGGWPPARAWETSAAAHVQVREGVLELTLPPSGGGWPDVGRDYFWSGTELHCRARFFGGTRPAQFIHILQVRPEAVVTVTAAKTAAARHGYVQLHLGRKPSLQPDFSPPPHVTAGVADERELRFLNRTEKLGFVPQPLVARLQGVQLVMSRGSATGQVLSTPDGGFVTQVFLGSGNEQFIELEQLSPLYDPGTPAVFEVVLRGEPLRR